MIGHGPARSSCLRPSAAPPIEVMVVDDSAVVRQRSRPSSSRIRISAWCWLPILRGSGIEQSGSRGDRARRRDAADGWTDLPPQADAATPDAGRPLHGPGGAGGDGAGDGGHRGHRQARLAECDTAGGVVGKPAGEHPQRRTGRTTPSSRRPRHQRRTAPYSRRHPSPGLPTARERASPNG